MEPINLKSFKKTVEKNKRRMRMFLTKVEKNPPRRLDALVEKIDQEVWQEVDCLSCSNCCRSMTPTFNVADIERISAHFKQTPDEFKKKWLHKDKGGDWMNIKTPCQFLDLKSNKCSIYAIRPEDCAGFPHLTKKKMTQYIHVHKQNIAYCPATFKMVEKMQLAFAAAT
ncbi:MAG: YkgJ family cysteine cluster protein [bacterium]|jgi:Fe-S-cluster containining protein